MSPRPGQVHHYASSFPQPFSLIDNDDLTRPETNGRAQQHQLIHVIDDWDIIAEQTAQSSTASDA